MTEKAGNKLPLLKVPELCSLPLACTSDSPIISRKRQLQSEDKSTSDLEKQLQELQAKRKRLSEQIALSQIRNDATSSTVIDSMFNE